MKHLYLLLSIVVFLFTLINFPTQTQAFGLNLPIGGRIITQLPGIATCAGPGNIGPMIVAPANIAPPFPLNIDWQTKRKGDLLVKIYPLKPFLGFYRPFPMVYNECITPTGPMPVFNFTTIK
ncbi:MAG: hypothetical protein NTX85_00660 [Candidatus Nomurabacteria bacterium]|nr:hypothetical protein [Candidatus Nomurabacteria bacterium]